MRLVGALAAPSVAQASDTSSPEHDAVAAVVSRTLPGSTTALDTAPDGATAISIGVPTFSEPGASVDPIFDPGPNPEGGDATFRGAAVSWRAALATSYVARTFPDLTAWRVTAGDGSSGSAPASGSLRASAESAAYGAPRPQETHLDTLSADQIKAQLDSNLSVIAGVLGDNLEQATATVIPIDADHRAFAAEADIRVHDINAARAHLDDLLFGPSAGLTAADGPFLEGSAVDVVDDAGVRDSGFSSRNAGALLYDRGSDPCSPGGLGGIDTSFPILTDGGQPPSVGVASCPTRQSPGPLVGPQPSTRPPSPAPTTSPRVTIRLPRVDRTLRADRRGRVVVHLGAGPRTPTIRVRLALAGGHTAAVRTTHPRSTLVLTLDRRARTGLRDGRRLSARLTLSGSAVTTQHLTVRLRAG